MQTRLSITSPIAERQPKTDRLILASLLKADLPATFDDDRFAAAHRIILKWADLESSGRLSRMKETQLQGDFLSDIFCHALGYRRAVDNQPEWTLEQYLHLYGISRDDAEYILTTFPYTQSPNSHLSSRQSLAEFILGQYDEMSE